MEHTFYVANLGPDINDEMVQAIFAPVGTILESKIVVHPKTEKPNGAAVVKIQTEATSQEITDQLNGQEVGGRHIAVSPAKPNYPLPKATQEQKDAAKEIAEALGETEEAPCRQILRLVRVCSSGFGRAILADALALEASGGLMVLDGTRRRTQGGVFFYLARGRMSYDSQGAIFPRRRDKKKRDAELAAAEAEKAAQQGTTGTTPKPPAKTGKKPKPGAKKKQAAPKGNHTAQPKAAQPPEPKHTEPAGEAISDTPPVDLEALRSQLDELQQAHHQAQANLSALQAQKGAKSMGTFSAIKQVVDLQRQIDEMLKAYPQLK